VKHGSQIKKSVLGKGNPQAGIPAYPEPKPVISTPFVKTFAFLEVGIRNVEARTVIQSQPFVQAVSESRPKQVINSQLGDKVARRSRCRGIKIRGVSVSATLRLNVGIHLNPRIQIKEGDIDKKAHVSSIKEYDVGRTHSRSAGIETAKVVVFRKAGMKPALERQPRFASL